ncbi:MAG: flagellar hook assembly protein FlgD [Desulfobacteraceae bacterium]|nr:flagellar hook assembly protein FlgD [Desulfobacteraceae bacterium]
MTVLGLDSVASRGGQTLASEKNTLGKNDFLNLMVAQLQAQDPLNPMDGTAYTAQLAQFSSLEQLQNLNTTLQGVGTSQEILTNSQAVNFIGKDITAVGNQFSVNDQESDPLQINLSANAAAVYIKIYDANGNFIRDIETGSMPEGQNTYQWDATDYLGGQAPDGKYTYEVSAIGDGGQFVEVTSFTQGTVTGVNFKNAIAYLLTENQEIPMGNVVQVLDNSLE